MNFKVGQTVLFFHSAIGTLRIGRIESIDRASHPPSPWSGFVGGSSAEGGWYLVRYGGKEGQTIWLKLHTARLVNKKELPLLQFKYGQGYVGE